jgi:hypothetical protein
MSEGTAVSANLQLVSVCSPGTSVGMPFFLSSLWCGFVDVAKRASCRFCYVIVIVGKFWKLTIEQVHISKTQLHPPERTCKGGARILDGRTVRSEERRPDL